VYAADAARLSRHRYHLAVRLFTCSDVAGHAAANCPAGSSCGPGTLPAPHFSRAVALDNYHASLTGLWHCLPSNCYTSSGTTHCGEGTGDFGRYYTRVSRTHTGEPDARKRRQIRINRRTSPSISVGAGWTRMWGWDACVARV